MVQSGRWNSCSGKSEVKTRCFRLKQIGVAHTPFQEPGDVKNPRDARWIIEVFSAYTEGLKDLEGFSHVFLIWHFHRSEGCEMQCCPTRYRIPPPPGLFATRTPSTGEGSGHDRGNPDSGHQALHPPGQEIADILRLA